MRSTVDLISVHEDALGRDVGRHVYPHRMQYVVADVPKAYAAYINATPCDHATGHTSQVCIQTHSHILAI